MRWPTPYFPKTDYHAAGRRLDLARQILFWSIFHRLRTSLAPCAGRLIDRLGMEFGARDSAAYPVALGPRRRLRSSHVRGLDKGKKRTDERTRTADLESHYECAGRRCWGVHSLANAAFLGGFLFCDLLSVAPYCARGGIRVVSTSDWTAGQHAYNRYHYGGQVPAASSITTRDFGLRSPYFHHGPRRCAPHLAGRRGVLRPRGT